MSSRECVVCLVSGVRVSMMYLPGVCGGGLVWVRVGLVVDGEVGVGGWEGVGLGVGLALIVRWCGGVAGGEGPLRMRGHCCLFRVWGHAWDARCCVPGEMQVVQSRGWGGVRGRTRHLGVVFKALIEDEMQVALERVPH